MKRLIVPIIKEVPWIKRICQLLKKIISQNMDHSKEIEVQVKYATGEYHKSIEHELITIKRISNQYPISVREALSQPRYNFRSCFPDFKKFYFVKDYLTNFSQANEKYPQKSNNFYHGMLKLLQIKFKENQLRVDLNYEPKKERYTYSYRKGWEKIKKSKMQTPVDIIFNEKQLRLTINQEKKQWTQSIEDQIQNILKTDAKKVNFRLKNISKFQKEERIEIALSEVLNIKIEKQPKIFEALMDYIKFPEQMDDFLVSAFANFYDYPINYEQKRVEIESEITQEGYHYLKKLYIEERNIQFQAFIQILLSDLASLYFADYVTKNEEIPIIASMYKQKYNKEVQVVSRLQSVIGGYMREEIDYYLQNRK